MRSTVRSGSPYEAVYGYSRATRVGDRVLVAGTAPVPLPGQPVAATAGEQMRRCADIALQAMAELGATAADIVRTRMYITDAAFADEVGAVHGETLGVASPVATMVVVAGLIDPSWLVEIEVEAVVS